MRHLTLFDTDPHTVPDDCDPLCIFHPTGGHVSTCPNHAP